MSGEFERKKLDMLLEEEDWDSLLEEDGEFDAAVKEEYMKEAEEIEKSLFPEGISREPAVSEEETRASYERLVELMKKKGIYREDTPVDGAAENGAPMGVATGVAPMGAAAASVASTGAIAAGGAPMSAAAANGAVVDGVLPDGMAAASDLAGERSRRAMHRQFKMVRVAGVAAACLLGVFLVSMTSQANRQYLVRSIGILLGNDAYLSGNNSSENEMAVRDEKEAREKIEEELGVKAPEILFYPESFTFYDYQIQTAALAASIKYMYQDEIIVLDIYNYETKSNSQSVASHGDEQNVFYIENGDISVRVTESIDEGEKIPRYTAQWKIENIVYQFSGRMEKEVFQEMIKSMEFS